MRSKGLVQDNNSKHFPIDQYLHDRVTPATLSPKAYDKPIHPSKMPRIYTCTDTITDDTNVPTKDDKYPWLDPDDKRMQNAFCRNLLFAGFLVPSCPKHALVWGTVVRGFVRRDLC